MRRYFFYTLIFILSSTMSYAQEEVEFTEAEEEFNHHSISLGISHAHVSTGIQNGDTKWLVLPSWFLDYNYWFNKEWAIGFHTDMIVETFEVEAKEGDKEAGTDGELERNRPVALVGAVSYEALPWLVLVAGGGMEYEENESFGLIRLGLEPKYEITEKWEIVGTLGFDLRIDAYNTWSIGIGMARRF